jgi:hypothetical protein
LPSSVVTPPGSFIPNNHGSGHRRIPQDSVVCDLMDVNFGKACRNTVRQVPVLAVPAAYREIQVNLRR